VAKLRISEVLTSEEQEKF